MNPNEVKKTNTVLSGALMLLILAALVGLVVVIVLNPVILESALFIILSIVVVVLAIGIIIAVFTGVLAIPMYMKKGTEVQTNMSYSLDDVKEVDGEMEKKN